MITEWLLELSALFSEWTGGLFPQVDVADAVREPFFGLGPVVAAAIGWGVWVNVPGMVVCAVLLFSTYGVTAITRLVRTLLGHIPVVGGNG